MKPVRKRNKRTVMDYTKVGAFLDRRTGSICVYLLGKDNSPLMALKLTDENAEKLQSDLMRRIVYKRNNPRSYD